MNNKLPELFKLFNLEPGDKFKISNQKHNPYTVTKDYKIMGCNRVKYNYLKLNGALFGVRTITKLPKITGREDRILHALYDLGYSWIARDKEGCGYRVYAYASEPQKSECYGLWVDDGNYLQMDFPVCSPETDFQFIQWEDEEPFDIEKYVKEQRE